MPGLQRRRLDAMVAGGRPGGQVDRMPRMHRYRAHRSEGSQAPEARRVRKRLGRELRSARGARRRWRGSGSVGGPGADTGRRVIVRPVSRPSRRQGTCARGHNLWGWFFPRRDPTRPTCVCARTSSTTYGRTPGGVSLRKLQSAPHRPGARSTVTPRTRDTDAGPSPSSCVAAEPAAGARCGHPG